MKTWQLLRRMYLFCTGSETVIFFNIQKVKFFRGWPPLCFAHTWHQLVPKQPVHKALDFFSFLWQNPTVLPLGTFSCSSRFAHHKLSRLTALAAAQFSLSRLESLRFSLSQVFGTQLDLDVDGSELRDQMQKYVRHLDIGDICVSLARHAGWLVFSERRQNLCHNLHFFSFFMKVISSPRNTKIFLATAVN